MKFIEIKISSSSPLDSHFSSYDFLSSIKNKIVIADRLRTTTTTAAAATSTAITTTTTTTYYYSVWVRLTQWPTQGKHSSELWES